MKQEPELFKKILLWCEGRIPAENKSFDSNEVQIKGYSPFQINFHIKIIGGKWLYRCYCI